MGTVCARETERRPESERALKRENNFILFSLQGYCATPTNTEIIKYY